MYNNKEIYSDSERFTYKPNFYMFSTFVWRCTLCYDSLVMGKLYRYKSININVIGLCFLRVQSNPEELYLLSAQIMSFCFYKNLSSLFRIIS